MGEKKYISVGLVSHVHREMTIKELEQIKKIIKEQEEKEIRLINELTDLEHELRNDYIKEFIPSRVYTGQTVLFDSKPTHVRDYTNNMFQYHPNEKVKCIKKEFKRKLP